MLTENKKGQSRGSLVWALVFLTMGILIGAVVVNISPNQQSPVSDGNQTTTTTSTTTSLSTSSTTSTTYKQIDRGYNCSTGIYRRLYEKVADSVVSIKVLVHTVGGYARSQGSGFIYDNQGHIITNQHVIAGAEKVEIIFPNGIKKKAKVVGADKYSDIAVLQIDEIPEKSTSLPLADSTQVKPGEEVAAIGNPYGLSGSITHGIISATERMLATEGGFSIPNVVQTDAPLNPGNSGGPLLNLNGSVVGVNRAKEGDNLGFAIPANKVKMVADSIIQNGEFKHPWIGVTTAPVFLKAAELMGLTEKETQGLMVIDVVAGSPADRAGLQGADTVTSDGQEIPVGGDIITKIDDRKIESTQGILAYLDETRKKPGDKIEFTLYRDGNKTTTTLTLGTRP